MSRIRKLADLVANISMRPPAPSARKRGGWKGGRQALEILASSPDGSTEAMLLAQGFKADALATLGARRVCDRARPLISLTKLESQMKSGLPRRRDLAALSVMLVGWVVAFGPPKALAEPADTMALLAELMKLEAASWQYLKDTNVSAVNKYLADDAVLIFANGIHFTKAEYIKAMPDIRLDGFTIESNAEIRVWTPEVATLLYRITYTSAMKGANASTMKVLSSSTYVRSNGNWLSVIYQETPAP